jgi:acyl-coenzyme A synthetase/AMP-(fatty) acid ligase
MSSFDYRGEPAPARFNLARYCLAEQAATRPDALALTVVHDLDAKGVAGDAGVERWTFGQLDDAVRRVAAGLRSLGLERVRGAQAAGDPGARQADHRAGPRILLRLPNTSDYALLFFGAIAAGYVALPSSAMLTPDEVSFLVADAEVSAIGLDPSLPLRADSAPERPLPTLPVIGPEDIARFRRELEPVDYIDSAADDPALLIYTSGTTARPKGVLHAQRVAWGRRPMLRGWYGGLSTSDVVLHTGAFNWTYTLGTGLIDPWSCGASTVLYTGSKAGERDLTVWPRLIERFGATLIASVPGLYRKLLRDGELERYDLSSLRHGLVAGEALPLALLERWRATTGTELYEALGMSECSTYISSSVDVPVKVGSPGRPQTGRSCAVLSVDAGDGDTPLPVGQAGLLAVHRSDPALMLGYWRRPDEERAVFRGEWFVGGDLAAFDRDGYLRYRGRDDDVITALGYRVSPLEVEACLSSHPAVAEVAVAAVPMRRDVEVIAAFVVPADPREADAGELLAHARAHLAAYKCPRELIFVDALPRTANGKLMRRRLSRFAPANQ